MTEELIIEDGLNSPEGNPDNSKKEGFLEVNSAQSHSERPIEQKQDRASETYREILKKISIGSGRSTSSSDDEAQAVLDAKSVYAETDAETRVSKLLSIAEAKSVEYAVKVARQLGDFYVLDRMHDELSQKFYEALVAKGLIQK